MNEAMQERLDCEINSSYEGASIRPVLRSYRLIGYLSILVIVTASELRLSLISVVITLYLLCLRTQFLILSTKIKTTNYQPHCLVISNVPTSVFPCVTVVWSYEDHLRYLHDA